MRRVRRDERGSALLIALLFLALFSLWLTATLTSAEGGLHIAQSMKVQPSRLYSADAAIEKAIQKVRFAAAQGAEGGQSCDDSTTINGLTYFVQCTPQPGSGRAALGGSSPSIGILSLATDLNNEYGYIQDGNSIVRLDGGVYAHTRVKFSGTRACSTPTDSNCQQLNLCPSNVKTVTDGVLVKNSALVTSASAALRPPFVDTPTATDVGVPMSAADGLPASTISSVTPGGASANVSPTPSKSHVAWTLKFREDYPLLQVHCHHDAGTVYHGLFTSEGGLRPGEDASTVLCDKTRIVAAGDSLYPGDGQKNCQPYVLGGAHSSGADPQYLPPSDASGDAPPVSVPTSCGSGPVLDIQPGRYVNAEGLTWLTSNCDKIVHFHSGTYYFDFADTAPVWTIGNSNLKNFVLVAGDKAWDGKGVFTAEVKKENGANGKFYLSMSNGSYVFSSADADKYVNEGYSLPYGTQLDTAKGTAVGGLYKEFYLKFKPGSSPPSGGVAPGPVTLSDKQMLGSLCDNRADPAQSHPGAEFVFGGQSRLDIIDGKTEICSPVNGSAQQIAIYGVNDPTALGHSIGTLRAGSGCVAGPDAIPYKSIDSDSLNRGCALIKAGGPKPVFIVHGTVYAPGAAIDLSLQTVGYQIVSRGIIARVIALGISPSAQFTEPVIYSPDFGSVTGADREMLLTACANVQCSSGGRPKLRAMVRIQDHEDPPSQANVSPGYRVKVESWTVLR